MRSGELSPLYHELAQLLRTGLPLSRAAETLERAPLPAASRAVIGALRSASDRGEGISEALAAVPALDRAVLAAGEKSGHLDHCLTGLAAYHGALDTVRQTIVRKSAYPVFLVHFGALVLGLPKLVLGSGVRGYLLDVGATLGGVYAVVGGLALGAWALVRSARGSALAERFLGLVPVLGKTCRLFAVARFCMAYGTQLEAGIPVLQALGSAGQVSGSAGIRAAADRALPHVQRGESPTRFLAGALPDPVVRGLVVGEETGTLDQELDRWATWHRERAMAGLETLGEWVPRMLYFGVAALLAWKIVGAYQQYLAGLSRALEF
jgi:general secretion pathway protein F